MGGVFVKSAGVSVARGRWCSMWFGVRMAHPRRRTGEPAVRAGLDIGEELGRQRRLNVPIGLLKRLAPDPVPLFLTGRLVLRSPARLLQRTSIL